MAVEMQAPPTIPGGAPNSNPKKSRAMFEPSIVKRALVEAFTKLDPRQVAKNPVMFVVEIGSVLTSYLFIKDLISGNGNALFTGQTTLWL